MENSQPPGFKTLTSTLGNIERVTEPKFFFLFSAFVFALDCGINHLTHKNLYTLGTGINISSLDWGKLLVFFLIFSFLMALAMKVMRLFIEEFFRYPAISLSVWWDSLGGWARDTRSASEHSPWQAMKIALDRGDKLLYDVAKAKADLYSNRLQTRIENAQMAFSLLLFMVLNRFAIGGDISPTLLQQFAIWGENLEGNYGIPVVYGFGLWLFFLGCLMLFGLKFVQIGFMSPNQNKISLTSSISSSTRPSCSAPRAALRVTASGWCRGCGN